MCRTERRLEAAVELAHTAEFVSGQRLGAIIYASGAFLGQGTNSIRNDNPGMFDDDSYWGNRSTHAEISAIQASSYDKLQGANLYVARITKGKADIVLAAPCYRCMEIIHKVGISRVYYTTVDGYQMINMRRRVQVAPWH